MEQDTQGQCIEVKEEKKTYASQCIRRSDPLCVGRSKATQSPCWPALMFSL